MTFDPVTRQVARAALPPRATTEGSVISPDGKWMAFESMQAGPKQIWLRDMESGKTQVVSGGNCNSSSPAWEEDSRSFDFRQRLWTRSRVAGVISREFTPFKPYLPLEKSPRTALSLSWMLASNSSAHTSEP